MSLLSDLSASGLYVQTPSPAPVGETLALMFESPGKAIQARGIVRRSDPGRGMGVEFSEMSEDDRRRVVGLLQAALQQNFALRMRNAAGTPSENGKAATPPAVPSVAEPVVAAVAASPVTPTATPRFQVDAAAEDVPESPASALRPHVPPSGQRPSERRRQVRLIIPATIDIGDGVHGDGFRAAVGNIGREGCYVKTERAVPVGAELSVHITKGKFAFAAEARVAHIFAGKGFGLMFTAIEPDNVATFEAWLQSSHELSWWHESRRKTQRLTLATPVVVGIKGADGKWQMEKTVTVSISPQGASVLLATDVEVGQEVGLANPRTKGTAECRVAYKGQRQEEKWLVGLAFLLPNREFWKVAFPPANWSQGHPDAKRQSEPTLA